MRRTEMTRQNAIVARLAQNDKSEFKQSENLRINFGFVLQKSQFLHFRLSLFPNLPWNFRR